MTHKDKKNNRQSSEGTNIAFKTIIFLLTACIVLLMISISKNGDTMQGILQETTSFVQEKSSLFTENQSNKVELTSNDQNKKEEETETSQSSATALGKENLVGYIPIAKDGTKYQLEVYKNSHPTGLAAHYCDKINMSNERDCIVAIGTEISKMNGIPLSMEAFDAQEQEKKQKEAKEEEVKEVTDQGKKEPVYVEAAIFVNDREYKVTFDATDDLEHAASQFCLSSNLGLAEKGDELVASCAQQVYPLFRTYALAALSDVSLTIPLSLSAGHPAHEVSFTIGEDLVKVSEAFCGSHWEEVASLSTMGEEQCVSQVKAALWESTKKAMDQYHTSLVEASTKILKQQQE